MANKEEFQYDDSRNPYYKQAQQDLDNNNASAAVTDYEAALAANPKLAGAHYELGIIYGDKLADPIGSIFHFKRYLELSPTSEKAEQVKALVDKQSQTFAASLPNSPTQSADDYAKLQADNASLKKQVEDATRTIGQLQAQLAQSGKHHAPAVQPAPAAAASPAPAAAPVVESTPEAVPATPAAPAPTAAISPRALPVGNTTEAATPATSTAPAATGEAPRSYKVVSGDSIWKIAHKMYPGDTKNGVAKIEEANKDTLGNKPLKIGQVLIIP